MRSGSGRIAWTLPATSCPSTCTVRDAPDATLAAVDGLSVLRLETSASSAIVVPLRTY